MNKKILSVVLASQICGTMFGSSIEQIVQFHSIGLKEDMLIQLIQKDDFKVTLEGLAQIQQTDLPLSVRRSYKDKIIKQLGLGVEEKEVPPAQVAQAKEIKEDPKDEVKKDSKKKKIARKDIVMDEEVEYFVGSNFVRFNVKNDEGEPIVFIFGRTKDETHFIFSDKDENVVYRKVHVDFLDKLRSNLRLGYKADVHMDNPFWVYKKGPTGEVGRAPTNNRFYVDGAYGDSPYGQISFTSDKKEEFFFYMRPAFFEIMKVICDSSPLTEKVSSVVMGDEVIVEKPEEEKSDISQRLDHYQQQLESLRSQVSRNGYIRPLLGEAPNIIKCEPEDCIERIKSLKWKTNYPIGANNFRYIGTRQHLVVTNDDTSAGTDPIPRDDQGRVITAITHPKLVKDKLFLLLDVRHKSNVYVADGYMSIVIEKGVKKSFLSKEMLIDVYYLKLNDQNYDRLMNLSDEKMVSYCETHHIKGLPDELRAK